MTDFMLEYANNIEKLFFLPVVASSLFAAIFAAFSFKDYLKSKYPVHSQEYNDNNWRTMAAVNFILLAWIVYGLIAALPKPDYIHKTKIVNKVRTVTKTGTYASAYSACSKGFQLPLTREEATFCDSRARILVFPNLKTIIRTIPGPVRVKVVYKMHPYKELYDSCMNRLDFKSVTGSFDGIVNNFRYVESQCAEQARYASGIRT